MRKAKRWGLVTAALLVLVIIQADAGAPFKKVALATTQKTTTTSTTTEEGQAAPAEETSSISTNIVVEEKPHNVTSTGHKKNSKLTGIPQIDYIWDPNLPRELNGYNLSSYPFLSIPPPLDEIHFKCDGLHDGFYASIEYKCQKPPPSDDPEVQWKHISDSINTTASIVRGYEKLLPDKPWHDEECRITSDDTNAARMVYHHCVYGIRHDFLCANFTAFDQKTFICHFASDVDCEGSKKYWNRNDALYMATTTTSTTTTTTEPPPTQRRHPNRSQRPLRRPGGRRPIDDYYYDQEDYDDDYYEERVNRRRKQKPRQRKPVVDYDDEYEDEKRSLGDEKPRRPNSRDRLRDDVDLEDEYDYKPKSRNKPTPAAERRKTSSRKPSAFVGRSSADERRSFSDDRPLLGRRKPSVAPVDDDVDEPVEPPPRRLAGRRRINEKRPSTSTASPASDLDDLDEYERPHSDIPDQEEAAADEDVPAKIKTTPKPIEDLITPKAASSSVYARPRAPPRIARPVPVNEKGKFKYPVQKTATTSAPPVGSQGDEDYYEDEEYDVRPRGHSRKRIADEVHSDEDDIPPTPRRGLAGRKPTRTLRKPVIEKNPVDEDEDYDVRGDRYNGRGSSRRRAPFSGRTRGRVPAQDDVDFVDDDYEERPAKRSKPSINGRKGAKKPKLPEPSEEIEADDVEPEPELKPVKERGSSLSSRRKSAPALPNRSRAPQAASLSSDDSVEPETADASAEPEAPSKPNLPTSRPSSVRVVKRPFLPSRGGSPYLPRGLQPVGVAHKPLSESHTTVSSAMDMYSTMSGSHLLEHGLPLLRDSGPRTTLPPRSPIPQTQPRPEHHHQHQPSSKATLDELYENDYDVTLNDALNPTLKPLSPHQSSHYHQHHDNNNDNNRPYQSIYSPPSAHSVTVSSSALSDPFVHKNQSPSSSSLSSSSSSSSSLSSASSASDHSQSVQHPSQIHSESQSQTFYHQQQHPLAQQHHQYDQSLSNNQNNNNNNHNNNHNNYNSDSNFSSTDIRRRTIASAPAPQSSHQDTRIAPNYYDEYEY